MRQLLTPSNAENSPIRTNFATEPDRLGSSTSRPMASLWGNQGVGRVVERQGVGQQGEGGGAQRRGHRAARAHTEPPGGASPAPPRARHRPGGGGEQPRTQIKGQIQLNGWDRKDVEQARRRSSRLVDHLAIVHQHVLVLRNQVLVPLVVEVGDILASLAYFSMRNSSPSTHARATLGTGSSSPGILSQSLSSMKVALFQGLTSPNSLSFS